MSERTSAIRNCEDLAATLEDTSELDQAIEAPQNEIDTVIEQNRRLIREQAVTGMPTEEFDERTATLNERYKAADEKLAYLPLMTRRSALKTGMNRHGTCWSLG